MDIHTLKTYEHILVGETWLGEGKFIATEFLSSSMVTTAMFAVGNFYNSTRNRRIAGALARLVQSSRYDGSIRLVAYQMLLSVMDRLDSIPICEGPEFDLDSDVDWQLVNELGKAPWDQSGYPQADL